MDAFDPPPEDVGPKPEGCRPREPAGGVEYQEAPPGHLVDAGEQRRHGSQQRHKPAEEDDLATVPFEQVVPDGQALRRESDPESMAQQERLTDVPSDPVAGTVARDRARRCGGDDRTDMQPVRGARIDCGGHQHRLARERQSHAFERDDDGNDGIAVGGD